MIAFNMLQRDNDKNPGFFSFVRVFFKLVTKIPEKFVHQL